VEDDPIGPRLRALRLATGRTVASVAADAGLSVPYIANLENGRGNPTTNALSRLAAALGTELRIQFTTPDQARPTTEGVPVAPHSPGLARLRRSRRFRATVEVLAEASEQDPDQLSTRLIAAFALLAQTTGREPSEPDWWRLLDALLLIATCPT
jgi:transcriptional regulator with XRE-family HTH domain